MKIRLLTCLSILLSTYLFVSSKEYFPPRNPASDIWNVPMCHPYKTVLNFKPNLTIKEIVFLEHEDKYEWSISEDNHSVNLKLKKPVDSFGMFKGRLEVYLTDGTKRYLGLLSMKCNKAPEPQNVSMY